MATPCPRCGTMKTESVRHGFIYETLWNMGYHLRRCSYCNRRRIFKLAETHRTHPDDMTGEELQEQFNRKIAEASGKRPAASEAVDRAEGMAPDLVEERHEPERPPNRSSIGVAEEDEFEGYHVCPHCGSTLYRRSHRRWYERMLNRPKMARCSRCDRRFPYPH
jgi:DNA-directed RNA polymerase subunit RPC12/RpoP